MSAVAQNISMDSVAATNQVDAKAGAFPWHCWVVALAAACIPLGAEWDISWHQTIGRDTFWTPAHMMIYVGGALPGMVCGWLVLRHTFWPVAGAPAHVVKLWGFRGPLGGWLAIWGSLAMLVSAPFDNWWHDAYGLDVKILSPPHTLLALGMTGVAVGAMVLMASERNRASDAQRPTANRLFLFTCGTLVTMSMIFVMEYSFPNSQHGGMFYIVTCLLLPLYPVIAARATGLCWAGTWVSLIFMMMVLAMTWILPLFPGEPKLAPIWNPVTHMVPPPWPVLAFVPAIGIDLIMRFLGRKSDFWRDNGIAVLMGVVFFLLLLGVQWYFSEFLLSKASRNAFFASDRIWSYGAGMGSYRSEYWRLKEDPFTLDSALTAVAMGIVVCRLGLWLGNRAAAIKR